MRPTRIPLVVVLALFISACCDVLPCLKGCPAKVDPEYTRILALPYMGGSLHFDAATPAMSHLVKGTRVPIRLAKLSRQQIPPDQVPEVTEAVYEYRESPGPAVFGYLDVAAITPLSITFDATLYNAGGTQYTTRTLTLDLTRQADLDGDGVADVEYVDSINPARPRSPDRAYLRFLSSQSSLNTTMYSYAPELNRSHQPAGGNLGYNLNGNAILRVDSAKAARLSRSVVPAPGDILMDVATRSYRRIDARGVNAATKAAGDLSLRSLTESASELESFSDAVPLFSFHSGKGGPAARSKSLAPAPSAQPPALNILVDAATYKKRVDALKADVADQQGHFKFNLPKLAKGGDFYNVGALEPIHVNVGISADAGVAWSHVEGSVTTLLVLEGYVGAEVFKRGAPVNIEEPLWGDSISSTFTVGPLIVDLGIGGEIGYFAKIEGAANAKAGVRVCVAHRSTVSMSVSFLGAWAGPPAHSEEFFMTPDLNVTTSLTASASAGLYVKLMAPEIKLEKLLFVNLSTKATLGPYWNVTAPATIPSNLATVPVETKFGVGTQVSLRIKGGAKVSFHVGPFYKYKEWSPLEAEIFSWAAPLWEKSYTVYPFKEPGGEWSVSVHHPAPDCAPGEAHDAGGRCTKPNEETPIPDNHDGGPPAAKNVIAVYLRGPARPGVVRSVIWTGSVDREQRFRKAVSYSLDATPGCILRGTSSPCYEIRERFVDLEAGPWHFEAWDDYNLMAAIDENPIDGSCWVVRCEGGSCDSREHNLNIPPCL